MATVKDLIKQLQEIENQEQPIIFQYYTAEMFIDPATDDNMEPDRFEKVADKVDDCDHFWDDAWEGIIEFIDEIDSDDSEGEYYGDDADADAEWLASAGHGNDEDY